MATVELRFQPRVEDIGWASRATLRSRPKIFWGSLALFCVLPLTLAAVEIVRAFQGYGVSGSMIAALIGIPVCMFGGAWVAPYLLFRNSPVLRDEQMHRYDAEGMTFRGRTFENRLQWSAVSQAHWIDEGLLLTSGRLLLVALPPRVLSDHTRAGLQSLLRQAEVVVKGQPSKRAHQ